MKPILSHFPVKGLDIIEFLVQFELFWHDPRCVIIWRQGTHLFRWTRRAWYYWILRLVWIVLTRPSMCDHIKTGHTLVQTNQTSVLRTLDNSWSMSVTVSSHDPPSTTTTQCHILQQMGVNSALSFSRLITSLCFYTTLLCVQNK